MTKRSWLLIWLVLLFPLNSLPTYGGDVLSSSMAASALPTQSLFNLTSENNTVEEFLGCFSTLPEEAMKEALSGYAALNEAGKISKKDIITIIDFSKPSTEERLFVINLKTKQIIAKSLCAHGRNSGEVWAEKFSNKAESYASSLGFYIASETYDGKNGYSLKLDGQENGFNDNARERGVVIHAADYVSTSFVNANGKLGRSQGCPALPIEKNQTIISLIKGGSCLFIYHPNKYYKTHSPILKHYNESCLADVVSTFFSE